MRVLMAPDKLAGSCSAQAAAAALSEGWLRSRPSDEVVIRPVSDGGAGLVAVLAPALGVLPLSADVTGPLGQTVRAPWLLLADGTAVIESAGACGLALLAPAERDPMVTTSYGVGELVLAALDAGARRVVVGLGGSATNDGGAGALLALGAVLRDGRGAPLPPGGGALQQLATLDLSGLDPRLASVPVELATDVDSPLLGPHGASATYAPQKGADARAVTALEAGLARWAAMLGGAPQARGAGAAGGLGYALQSVAAATTRPGLEVVAELVGLDPALDSVEVVVVAEGRFDWQSLRGKAPVSVARRAQRRGIPCVLIAGQVEVGRRELGAAGIDAAYALVDEAGSAEAAMADPRRWLSAAAARAAEAWSR